MVPKCAPHGCQCFQKRSLPGLVAMRRPGRLASGRNGMALLVADAAGAAQALCREARVESRARPCRLDSCGRVWQFYRSVPLDVKLKELKLRAASNARQPPSARRFCLRALVARPSLVCPGSQSSSTARRLSRTWKPSSSLQRQRLRRVNRHRLRLRQVRQPLRRRDTLSHGVVRALSGLVSPSNAVQKPATRERLICARATLCASGRPSDVTGCGVRCAIAAIKVNWCRPTPY